MDDMDANEFAEFDISEAEFDAMLAQAGAAKRGQAVSVQFGSPVGWYQLDLVAGGGAAAYSDRRTTHVVSSSSTAASTAV